MSFTTVTEDCRSFARQDVAAGPMEDALRVTVVQALGPYQGALRLGENACLEILSAEDRQDHFLHPAEVQALPPQACARKRTEWTLGRATVRRALLKLGEDPLPVLRSDHGDPVWPEGITGSITHCWPWTGALLIMARKHYAVGIDLANLEQAARVDISSVICTPAELEWARGGNFPERLAMIFSAKEAVYKGFHRFCRRYIDFKEVELSWLPQPQWFRVAFLGGLKPDFAAFGKCDVLSRRINRFVFSCLVHDTQKACPMVV
ncbi:MAG TPA: 4'-phosphopantetheinyl transferase superfamily protein [Candidatus Angelobacter sp.]|nr:4'-phosphopantetheinyl transferase superfamily protein [Candidatus Angelobacter sp.]